MKITKEWAENAIKDSIGKYLVVWYKGKLMMIYEDRAEISTVFGFVTISKDDAIRRLELIDVRSKTYEDGRWELNDEIRVVK